MNGCEDEGKRYDVQAVKDRLVGYVESEREIDNQIERLERLESKMYGVGSPQLTDMPKAPSPSGDRIADMIAQKERLETEIRELIQHQSDERNWIEGVLKKLKKSDHRAVIRMRYIDGEKWNDITFMLFGGRDDYDGKESAYMRTVANLHGRALLNIAKIIEDGQ